MSLQAVKQKFQFKRNTGNNDETLTPQEEDKAKILFGTIHVSIFFSEYYFGIIL